MRQHPLICQTAILVVLSIFSGGSLVLRSSSRQYHPVSTIRNVSLAVSALPLEINVVNQGDGNSSSESLDLPSHNTNVIQNTQSPLALPAGNKTTTNSSLPRLSIVLMLGNGLGNHLSRIAQGFALQKWSAEYGLQTDLVFGDDDRPDGTACFPGLRPFNFHGTTARELDYLLKQQECWFGGDKNHSMHKSLQLHNLTEETILEGLSVLRNVSHWTNRTTANTTNVTLPLLVVAGDLVPVGVLTDKYYEDLRRLLAFDDENCCKLKPDPDETVLHFRNFAKELGRRSSRRGGFSELDPSDTAHHLLGHLQPGDKVAITSRFAEDDTVQPYVDALTNRSLHVRVITGQSGVEDFCFLRHTKKELVGVVESTFVFWAGYLGNATRVLLYSIDSKFRRRSYLGRLHGAFVHYNWTNPSLRDRVHFKLIQLD